MNPKEQELEHFVCTAIQDEQDTPHTEYVAIKDSPIKSQGTITKIHNMEYRDVYNNPETDALKVQSYVVIVLPEDMRKNSNVINMARYNIHLIYNGILNLLDSDTLSKATALGPSTAQTNPDNFWSGLLSGEIGGIGTIDYDQQAIRHCKIDQK